MRLPRRRGSLTPPSDGRSGCSIPPDPAAQAGPRFRSRTSVYPGGSSALLSAESRARPIANWDPVGCKRRRDKRESVAAPQRRTQTRASTWMRRFSPATATCSLRTNKVGGAYRVAHSRNPSRSERGSGPGYHGQKNGGIVRFRPRLRRYKLPRTLLSPLTWSQASMGLPRSRALATLDHDTPRSLSVLASGVTCWRFSSRSVAAATARVAPSVDGHAVRAVDPSSAARSRSVPLARSKRWPATTQHDVLPGAAT